MNATSHAESRLRIHRVEMMLAVFLTVSAVMLGCLCIAKTRFLSPRRAPRVAAGGSAHVSNPVASSSVAAKSMTTKSLGARTRPPTKDAAAAPPGSQAVASAGETNGRMRSVQIQVQLAPLLRDLVSKNLITPGQAEELAKLVTEKQQALADAIDIAGKENITKSANPEEFAQLIKETSDPFDKEMVASVGLDAFEQLSSFEQNIPAHNAVAQIEAILPGGSHLDPKQEAQLLLIINKFNDGNQTDGVLAISRSPTASISDQIVQTANAILSADQMQALVAVQQRQLKQRQLKQSFYNFR